MTGRADVLVTAEALADSLAAGAAVTLLDVRWTLSEPDGRALYLRGHLPGAVYVSLEDDLTDHAVAGRGRHPLPSGAALQAAARRWGVRSGIPVVVYDDWNRAGSARAWWVLTAAGIADVRILDGGLSAWQASGGAIEAGPVDPTPGDVTVRHDDLYTGALSTLTADEVGHRRLLDARAPERFRGEVEPVDPVAGHIPGAQNLPSTALLGGDGAFVADAALDELLGECGIGPDESIGVYCGSGITAAVAVAALTATGRDAALFPGSWSQWCSDPNRPVARGQ
ncbi:sulfurtransferase [Mycobacterium sp. CVI_P3]|uniref:Sulfurtransferase n=1 Tax=Mycobacterium pinniadriaticum TaxID=2994102 RepID=A0ABT3S9S5_9MYCO|nr:sulfurtransferase [Mycobacterium pinniadriaticum]MCX2929454.1 sulfurtransferase [Mycobacterium pinniadriaticum]MCX2935878.1 sulfurtransferase [Mycobacterium pinniadriaticum]